MHSKRHRPGAEAPPFVDPLFAETLSSRHDQNHGPNTKSDHKTRQLCRQVQRALTLALAGECGDDVLRDLWVESVVPAPNAGHLIVRIVLPARAHITMADVLERLDRVRGLLRHSVTRTITRKRSPELTFVPVPPGEVIP